MTKPVDPVEVERVLGELMQPSSARVSGPNETLRNA
jgi:hypothetical protein